MGGGGGKKKKDEPDVPDTPVLPDNINPFTPMGSLPVAYGGPEQGGQFTPMLSPDIMAQLAGAFSPEFLASISQPVDLPRLPVTASGYKKDKENG